MRSIAEGLRSYLDAHTSTGGYPVKLEYADHSDGYTNGVPTPFHVIHRRGNAPYAATDDGDGGTGLWSETFDIVSHAPTNAVAHSLADAISSHLVGLSPGTAMGSDRVMTDISDVSEEGEFDANVFGDEKGWCMAGSQIWIQHKAA